MIDYCDAPDEQQKNPQAKQWLLAVANGDAAAYAFLWRFWCFTHLYDDLVDRDKPVNGEIAARELMGFIHSLSFNPFYLKYRDQLFSLIVQALTRWLDGDEWEKSDDEFKRVASRVVRCGDIDLYMHAAYLTGGWDRMRTLKELRSYDDNDEES
jgi:hypothetical protein